MTQESAFSCCLGHIWLFLTLDRNKDYSRNKIIHQSTREKITIDKPKKKNCVWEGIKVFCDTCYQMHQKYTEALCTPWLKVHWKNTMPSFLRDFKKSIVSSYQLVFSKRNTNSFELKYLTLSIHCHNR